MFPRRERRAIATALAAAVGISPDDAERAIMRAYEGLGDAASTLATAAQLTARLEALPQGVRDDRVDIDAFLRGELGTVNDAVGPGFEEVFLETYRRLESRA
jgi:hypothetical protein